MSLPGLSALGNLLSKGPDPLGLFSHHGRNGAPGLDDGGPPGLNGRDHDGPESGHQTGGPERDNATGNNYPPAHGREEVPVNVARQLDAPGAPPAPPGLPSLPAPPAGPLTSLVQQVVAVPGNLLNALTGNPAPQANAAPGLAPPVLAAAAQTLQQLPGVLPQTLAAVTTAGVAAALPANVGAAAGTLAAAQAAPAANAAAAAPMAPATAAAATTANPQATAAQPASTAATLRSDAIPTPPRPESASLLDRLAAAQRMNAAPATMAPAASLPASMATQAAVVAALPMATTAPLGQTPPVDARGVPLAINDRAAAQAARADGAILPGGYTGEGPQRRTLRGRAEGLLTTPMSRLLMALGAAGDPAAMSEAEAHMQAERDLERAMQWVFWVLAIVAYGCVAMAMIGLLAGGGHSDFFDRFNVGGNHPQSIGFAFVGLVAGGAAWWLARRLSRR